MAGSTSSGIMATIHISEAEATRDFRGVLARVREGTEVVIEGDTNPIAVIRTAPARPSISECIALAHRHEEESGEAPVLDPDLAADVDEIICNRKSWNLPVLD